MFDLIKKDYLIVRKMWIAVMLIEIIIPIFMAFASGDRHLPAGLILSITSILLSTMLFSAIDEEEEKYPKAAALITTIGYSRNVQVIKRFVLMALIFTYCTIVYTIESYVIKNILRLSLFDVMVSIFFFSFRKR